MVSRLWNTGVDDLGRPLATGSIDPNWKLIQGKGFSFTDPPQKAYVVNNQQTGNYFGTSDSMWIWADASAQGKTGIVYVFETRFYIDADPAEYWIQISGKWGADNFGQITLDRHSSLPAGSFSGEVSLPSGTVASNFQQTHDFSISTAHAFSVPQSQLHLGKGEHALNVWVQNEGMPDDPSTNPAGFNMSALRIDVHAVRYFPKPVAILASWLDKLGV